MEIGNRTRIVILDACRDNPLAERDWQRFEIATTEHVPTIEAYIAQYANSEPLWAARARQRLEVVQAMIAEHKTAREDMRPAKGKADTPSPLSVRLDPGKPGERDELWKGAEERAEAREDQEVEARRFAPITIHIGLKGKEGERTIKPGSGKGFKDFQHGPEMVIVPKGEFLMGSPKGEEGRSHYEGPQYRVTIPAPFAIGRYSVTFAEWDAFVSDGGAISWLQSQ